MRYLVEAATGVFTGSVFNDPSIARAGHYGEARHYRDGSTLLQKTHHRTLVGTKLGLSWGQGHIRQFGGRGVLVVRNPYLALLSYYNFQATGGNHTQKVQGKVPFDPLSKHFWPRSEF